MGNLFINDGIIIIVGESVGVGGGVGGGSGGSLFFIIDMFIGKFLLIVVFR